MTTRESGFESLYLSWFLAPSDVGLYFRYSGAAVAKTRIVASSTTLAGELSRIGDKTTIRSDDYNSYSHYLRGL
jgi:hypothetical protein